MYGPSNSRAKYKAPTLVVPSIMAVATKLSIDAVHSPGRRPNLLLNGPTESEDTNVPMVITDDMSCCTVGFQWSQLSFDQNVGQNVHRYSGL